MTLPYSSSSWHNKDKNLPDSSLLLKTIYKKHVTIFYYCMYVCVRGGPIRPLHCDPQWSIYFTINQALFQAGK
jgi:hypothetical protein